MNQVININNVTIGNHLPFTLIAGPCQIEGLDHALFMVKSIKSITDKLKIPFVYKSSFDKANRTGVNAARGVGIQEGLKILSKVKDEFLCNLLTDVHNESQCDIVAEVVDVLQIPAFLCRQTDLLKAAAETGKIINVKKGQFLAPWDMHNVYNKLKHFGAQEVMLTERGACFGYNTLVSDMRSLSIMSQIGAPVIFDATHSVQQPGGLGSASGGQRDYVPLLARAAVSVGVAGVFMEVHQDPDNAPSDGKCMLKLDMLKSVLMNLKQHDMIEKSNQG